MRGRAHGQANGGVAKESEQRQQHGDHHHGGAHSVCVEILAGKKSVFGERTGKRLDRVVKNPARQRIDDEQEADENNHVGQHRRLLHGAQNQPLNHQACDKRHRNGGEKRSPIRPTGLHQCPGDEGAECGHFTLGEINVVGGLVNHHQCQSDRAINGAVGQARGNLLEEGFHLQYPKYALRTDSSFLICSLGPESATLPVSSR